MGYCKSFVVTKWACDISAQEIFITIYHCLQVGLIVYPVTIHLLRVIFQSIYKYDYATIEVMCDGAISFAFWSLLLVTHA